MNFTQDEIAAIIGVKELELIAARREIGRLQQELAKMKEPKVTDIKDAEAASGAA